MASLLNKVESSFKAAMKGEESLHNLIWWWGVTSYLLSYFVIDRVIKINNIRSIDIIISVLMSVYFAWHIYVLKKCSPKKPVLSKEEKKKLRQEARKEFGKKFLRKLFLQEPISKWNPVLVTAVVDIFGISTFLGYVFN